MLWNCVSRLLSAVLDNTLASLLIEPKGEYRYAWGINSLKSGTVLCAFDSVNVKDEVAMNWLRLSTSLVGAG